MFYKIYAKNLVIATVMATLVLWTLFILSRTEMWNCVNDKYECTKSKLGLH